MSDASLKSKLVKFVVISTFVGMAVSFTGGFIFLLVINKDLPSIESLQVYEPKETSHVYSEYGEVIGEFFEQRRSVVEDIPEVIKQAFIAAEDNTFYSHQGLDFLGILRAAWVNFKSGKRRQGASTITQQVARAFLLSPEKTYKRKIKEAVLAWQIEQSLTKEQILFLYLNHIYLGHGAYGIAAASEVYFGKKLHEVTLSEAAILGGLPQAPSRYSPARNPDRVKRRQLYVLKRMREVGFITDEEHEEAANSEVLIEPRVSINKTLAPYFVEYIRQYVMKKYGARMVLQDGLKIYTTLNLDMQKYAQNALRKGLSDLEKRQGYRGAVKHLEEEGIEDYFKGRKFEERDDANVVSNENLEVSVSEVEGRGQIKMKPRPALKVEDFLEAIVVRVDDKKGEAILEYEPGYFARIKLAEMKWAHDRIRPDDDDQVVKQVRKPSDVLKVGDVSVITVKALQLEKDKDEKEKEEASDNDQEDEFENPMIEATLEQHTEVEGALMSVDPRNGYVRAMVGGYDFKRSEFNRAVQAKRQPGSAFKPVIYSTALDIGFTPASILQDSPITFDNDIDKGKWRPNNYDRKFVGDTTLRSSLLTSRNITTIKLLNEVGIERAISYARRLGIESPLGKDFTMGLGSNVMPLKEVLQPYIVFAGGGYAKTQIIIKKIVDRNGLVLESNVDEKFIDPVLETVNQSITNLKRDIAQVVFSDTSEEEAEESSASFLKEVSSRKKRKLERKSSALKPGQVLSSESSFIMTHLLKENVLYGSGRRARALKRPACGKTGTTDENRDAWFLGFTPQLVTGVWVGYDDLRRLGRYETGSRAAVPIWVDFMINAMAPFPKQDFEVPENIEFARIDPKTGTLATSSTKKAVFEAFVKGTAPTQNTRSVAEPVDLYERDL